MTKFSLIAALVAGAVAVSGGLVQKRAESAGSSEPSNCPPGSKDKWCSLKTLAYDPKEIDAKQACDSFHSLCAALTYGAPYNMSMIYSCDNDQAANVIHGSCVQANCDGTFLGYTSVIPLTISNFDDGDPIFKKADKCGKKWCPRDPATLPKSEQKPVQLTYPDGKKVVKSKGSCPYPPNIGHHL